MHESSKTLKNELEMKTVADLCGYHFVIPSYQRGYRWTKEQVEALIGDIQEFADKKDKGENEFYCLQPIVVKPRKTTATLNCSLANENHHLEGGEIQIIDSSENIRTYQFDSASKEFTSAEFEVIDGQQRLTTIFLILKLLNQDESFSLKYDTRTKTTKALNNPEEASVDQIDEWHIKEAWKVINEKSAVLNGTWKATFLNHTQVIWYEPEGLSDENDKDSIEIFSRLNVGKIPLTNSELIRALFILNTKGKPPSQLNEYKIASEWDFIEQQLHNDDFWCFCNLGNPFGKKEYPNRIEFFFDLVEQNTGNANQSHQNYSTFAMYSNWLSGTKTRGTDLPQDVEHLWQEIKNLYYRFHEWFIDDSLYHLIGIVRLSNKKSLPSLLSKANSKKQSELQKHVLELVKEKVTPEKPETWEYGSDNAQIQNALLLFNLLSYQQEGRRFPWRRYIFKADGTRRTWSLEHINAQNQMDLEGEKWMEWARSFTDTDLQEIVERVTENNPSQSIKNDFAEKLNELQGMVDKYEHSISNLALLDRDDNSSLGNCIFSEKRKKIRAFAQSPDHFIPLATMNVFMKVYGEAKTMWKWEKEDCETYNETIATIFTAILPKSTNSEKDANNDKI